MQFELVAVDTKTLSEQGLELTLKALDGDPLKVRSKVASITFAGPDSKRFRDAMKEVSRLRLKAGETKQEVDEEHLACVILARATMAWSEGFCDPKGKPIACDYEAALALYTQYPIIREQAEEFAGRRSNFLQPSLKK